MGRKTVLELQFQTRKRRPFTKEEVAVLMQQVKKHKAVLLHPANRIPGKQIPLVRDAWEEISAIVSAECGTSRGPEQCRKRFNDMMRRRGKMHRKRGRPPKSRFEEDIDAILEANLKMKPEELDFEILAPLEDDPENHEIIPDLEDEDDEDNDDDMDEDYEPINNEPGVKKPVVIMQKMPMLPTQQHHQESPPQPKERSVVRPNQYYQPAEERHPFLKLQQGGFDMLQRELSGFRESIVGLDKRMTQIETLLRPIGHIADSLARIATAVELLTCPPSPEQQ